MGGLIISELAIAVWASSTSGSLIETIYVSPDFAYADDVKWFGKRFNRAEILPIWRNKYTLVSGLNPNGELDSTTGATAKHEFTLSKYLEGLEQEFVINVEINRAHDETAHWPSKIKGEPSILYTAFIENNPKGSSYSLLELTGHGVSDQNVGKIQYQFNNIDTTKLPIEFGLVSIVRN